MLHVNSISLVLFPKCFVLILLWIMYCLNVNEDFLLPPKLSNKKLLFGFLSSSTIDVTSFKTSCHLPTFWLLKKIENVSSLFLDKLKRGQNLVLAEIERSSQSYTEGAGIKKKKKVYVILTQNLLKLKNSWNRNRCSEFWGSINWCRGLVWFDLKA